MFESALIESTRQKVDKKRWMTLPLAILLHVVIIGSAVALSLWYIEEIPDPPIPVSFYVQAAPPPPPPPPPKAAAPKAQPKIETPVNPQMVSPVVVPETLPMPSAVDTGGEGVEGGVEGGVPGGSMGGVLGGVPGGVLGGTPGVEEPMRVGGEVKEPIEISRVKPQYPEAARKARMQGVVILEAIITKVGNVESVRVLRGLNPLLDNAAMRAVQQWKYKPATFNGRPVPVYLTVTVTFTLQ
jgi:protein TonB